MLNFIVENIALWIAIIVSIANMVRGNGSKFINWWVLITLIGLSVYYVTPDVKIVVHVLFPWLVIWLGGTGGLFQAFTRKIINVSELWGFDQIARLLSKIPLSVDARDETVISASKARKWGVWFGTLIGCCFAYSFVITTEPLVGLFFCGLGLYYGACRYLPDKYYPYSVRIMEGFLGFTHIYLILRSLAVCI